MTNQVSEFDTISEFWVPTDKQTLNRLVLEVCILKQDIPAIFKPKQIKP